MPKTLTSTINTLITNKDIKPTYTFNLNSVDKSSYLLSKELSYDSSFGAATATFVLNNNDSRFGSEGADEVKVGYLVELIENFEGDTTNWKSFYGIVTQRSLEKKASVKTITLTCYDYIGVLKNLDIDLVVEGSKVFVENEVLSPVYLAAPNDNLAQIFNFANNGIANQPIPLIKFKDKSNSVTQYQYDGFEVLFSTGQLKLGTTLNARDNFDVLSSYYYYSHGQFAEDIIEAIIKKEDSYGKFLFGETSAANVVANHLTTTYNTEEGTTTDTMTPNLTSKTITIETTLVYSIPVGVTSIILTDASGFPTSGTGTINGDTFTWSGKSGNVLTGIPASGDNSLQPHTGGDWVKYEATYSAGQVWNLKYTNILTALTSGNFTIGGGGVFNYFDRRNGRILLVSAINIISTVTCDVDYSFKTLQSSQIEINRMVFRELDVENRFEAIKKVKDYCPPNYIIRTQGDNKIWASYLEQKTVSDYTINLPMGIDYMEDDDLYTRVKLWAKHKNPQNIMLDSTTTFSAQATTNYSSEVVKTELLYVGRVATPQQYVSYATQQYLSSAIRTNNTEIVAYLQSIIGKYINAPAGSIAGYSFYAIFISTISGRGNLVENSKPRVYFNGVEFDNQSHQEISQSVQIKTQITYNNNNPINYYYTVYFPHSFIDQNNWVYLYKSNGALALAIAPNSTWNSVSGGMIYRSGQWAAGYGYRNTDIENISTATYNVWYYTYINGTNTRNPLYVDYKNCIFFVSGDIAGMFPYETPYYDPITNQPIEDNGEYRDVVEATFEYQTTDMQVEHLEYLSDGRADTEFQVEFFSEVPSDYHLFTVDFSETKNIQAIDIVGGFYRPDELRKFEVGFRLNIMYSTDNVIFNSISDKTSNLEIKSGEAISLDDEDLGNLSARYLKFTLMGIDKLEYDGVRYVVSIGDISVYEDIVISSESTLIPTTTLNGTLSGGESIVTVLSTSEFSSSGTAYLNAGGTSGNIEDAFTYTGKTSTTFTGCSGVQAQSNSVRVAQSLETTTTLYDDENLLSTLGDRVYKLNKINDNNLYVQSEIDNISKAYLKEFYKNHSKVSLDILFCPYIRIGQTVLLTDTYNNINLRYFIEQIKEKDNFYSLVLGRYP